MPNPFHVLCLVGSAAVMVAAVILFIRDAAAIERGRRYLERDR